jgi:hypothetical protein
VRIALQIPLRDAEIVGLIEFELARRDLSFRNPFPEREGKFLYELDPLSGRRGKPNDPPNYAGDLVSAFTAARPSITRIRLFASCRGAVLVAPLVQELSARGIETVATVIVDPVLTAHEDVTETLAEFAVKLGIEDPQLPTRVTLQAAEMFLAKWLDAYFGDIDLEPSSKRALQEEMFGLYRSWIEYLLWAADAVVPQIPQGRNIVVSDTDPLALDWLLAPGVACEWIKPPLEDGPLVSNPEIMRMLRDAAGLSEG